MKLQLLLPALIAFTALSAPAKDLDPAKYSSSLRRFIADVVYEVEAGDRDKYFKRLPANLKPTFHGDAAQKQCCDTALKSLLEATSVSIDPPASTSAPVATLDIYFGDSAAMLKTATAISKQISTDKGATYWKWWDDNHVTTRAVILICTDRFKGPELEDKLTENLLAVFGLPSQSKVADNTCMKEGKKKFITLQPLDIAVLEFLYTQVPAGTRPSDLNKLVREKWEAKP